jgi:hypothetical protein
VSESEMGQFYRNSSIPLHLGTSDTKYHTPNQCLNFKFVPSEILSTYNSSGENIDLNITLQNKCAVSKIAGPAVQ